jgi:hypothetical protein
MFMKKQSLDFFYLHLQHASSQAGVGPRLNLEHLLHSREPEPKLRSLQN